MALERHLVEHKLALYNLTLTAAVVETALARTVADWERDLRPLLPQYVEAEIVLRGIGALKQIADATPIT